MTKNQMKRCVGLSLMALLGLSACSKPNSGSSKVTDLQRFSDTDVPILPADVPTETVSPAGVGINDPHLPGTPAPAPSTPAAALPMEAVHSEPTLTAVPTPTSTPAVSNTDSPATVESTPAAKPVTVIPNGIESVPAVEVPTPPIVETTPTAPAVVKDSAKPPDTYTVTPDPNIMVGPIAPAAVEQPVPAATESSTPATPAIYQRCFDKVYSAMADLQKRSSEYNTCIQGEIKFELSSDCQGQQTFVAWPQCESIQVQLCALQSKIKSDLEACKRDLDEIPAASTTGTVTPEQPSLQPSPVDPRAQKIVEYLNQADSYLQMLEEKQKELQPKVAEWKNQALQKGEEVSKEAQQKLSEFLEAANPYMTELGRRAEGLREGFSEMLKAFQKSKQQQVESKANTPNQVKEQCLKTCAQNRDFIAKQCGPQGAANGPGSQNPLCKSMDLFMGTECETRCTQPTEK